ncbi:MAG: PAS domain-containing protein [Burkholderiales bacterium]|nr:PAS domain-containing protein [Burkholderiales bacterium]MDE2454611.1 PAS domain-containing protein [Burkholderiales bacterium]
MDRPTDAGDEPRSSLFDHLPIGAYRSVPGGRMLRANPVLVRFNDYASEAELLAAVHDIEREWYVLPERRQQFSAAMQRDGFVRGFVSEVYRHRTRERVWISENAYTLRDAQGHVLCYEGTVEEVTDRVTAQAALAASEQRLREIANQVPGVVYRQHLGRDGRRRFSFVSEGVRALYGLDPAEVLADGEALRRMNHPADHAAAVAAIEAADDGGRAALAEFRIVRADGSVRWVQHTSSSVHADESGGTRVGVIVDISARQEAERALRDNEARWKLALESTGDGFWDWAIDAGYEVVSPGLLQMYGLEAADHGNRSDALDALTHPEDRGAKLQAREAHLRGETPAYRSEHRMRCRDGSWKWVLTRGLVIERDGAGRPLRMIGTHTDISERHEAETLRRERERNAAAQKAQSAFLSRVSHELRTPLNAIMGFAQLLELEGAGTPRQQDWVHHLIDSSRHLLALVNDLLDLSSAQTGQLPVVLAPLDAVALLRSVWTMHAADAAAAGLSLVDRLPATAWVRADTVRLKQVFSNLVSNAIKYNRPLGRIEFEAAGDGAAQAITVRDTGIGLVPSQIERLFNPFERAGAQNSKIAGTRLGLALSRQLAEAMGGHIDVRSQPGVGSAFTLRLAASPLPAAALTRART